MPKKNPDVEKLCSVLMVAAEKLATVEGPIWSSYKSGADIAKFVLECRQAVERGIMTASQQHDLWVLFAPTCDWDDVVGEVALANEIFCILDRLYGKDSPRV
jgi:hypothetical protein